LVAALQVEVNAVGRALLKGEAVLLDQLAHVERAESASWLPAAAAFCVRWVARSRTRSGRTLPGPG
jgi:hypothetical protein